MDTPPRIHLFRRDPCRNMARFYTLTIEPDLFGGVVLIRRWGRLGRPGQERRHWFAAVDQARKEQDAWLRRKLRRGYDGADARHGPSLLEPV
ncbi:WGR domain-containing protein [uncultured Paracoccus sp.]|uniref:WGR domain-containing protein n=1 Tax=uncultured Paracoccus sp. TaxID=189685 RepID=UPI0025CEE7D4|nr:WGR domain-containing protein [uncultured Paracoccus sp.]